MSQSQYHLPNLHHHQEQHVANNNSNNNQGSLPVTPKSNNCGYQSSLARAFRYDPYNNFSRVYVAPSPSTSQSHSQQHSASTTPRGGNNNNSRQIHQHHQQQGTYQQGSSTPTSCVAASQHDHDHYYHNVMSSGYSNIEHDYSYINNNKQIGPDFVELEVVSGTCTPTARMETEQNFATANKNNKHHQQQQHQEEQKSTTHPLFEQSSSSSDEDGFISSSSNSDENTNMIPKPRSQNNNNNKNIIITSTTEEEEEPMRAAVRTMQHLLQNVPYLFLDIVAESTVLCRDTHHRVGQNICAWSGELTAAELQAAFPHRYPANAVIKDVFVAQLPFDLPLSAIQLVADLLIDDSPDSRINIIHAAPHIKSGRSYDGCSFVKMFECDAIRFIHAMHKRVLFDVDGVWVATALAELQELTDYCAWFQEQKNDQRKEILKMPTPFSAMTAEFALRGSNHNGGNMNQHNQNKAFYPRHNNNGNHYNNNNNRNVVVDQNPHQRHLAQHINNAQRNYNNNNQNNYNNNQTATSAYHQNAYNYYYGGNNNNQQQQQGYY